MSLLPIAAGLEGVIWVIILVIWSVAQFIQKSRAAQRRPPQAPGRPPPLDPQPPPELDRELQELLRELTGQAPAGRPYQPEVEEDTETAAEEMPPPAPTPAPRTPAPVYQSAPPPPTPAPASPTLKPSAVDWAESLDTAFAGSGRMPGLTLKMPGINLRGLSPPITRGKAGGRVSTPLGDLRDRRTLRRMMLARMVLEPPAALRTSPPS